MNRFLFLAILFIAGLSGHRSGAQVMQYEVSNPYIYLIGDYLQPPQYATGYQTFPWYTAMDTVYGAYQTTDTVAFKIKGHNHQLTFKTHFTAIAGATSNMYYTIYGNTDSSTSAEYQPYAPSYSYTYCATPKYVKSMLSGDWDAIHTFSLATSASVPYVQHDTYAVPLVDEYTNFMVVFHVPVTGAQASWYSNIMVR